MLRIEFRINLAGIPLRLFDIEEQVNSIEIDNALPVSGDMVFSFYRYNSILKSQRSSFQTSYQI